MSGDQLPSLRGRKRHQMPRVCPWEGMLKLWFDWYITTIKIINFCNIITDGPRAIWEEIVYGNETYVNMTLAFERCCVTKMWFTRVCVGTLRVCFNPLTPASNCPRPPPLISGRSMEYFRASESTKINHIRSNNRHKIRFQGFIYLKFNKWTAKY